MRLFGNFIFILLLSAILFSYAMFQGGFVSWFLFFSFLLVFLYQLSLLIYPISRWKITRTLSPQVVQAGSRILVTIHVERSVPYPLFYIVIEDLLPQTLYALDSRSEKFKYLNEPDKVLITRQFKKLISPQFRRKFSVSYELDFIPRGEHNLQSIRIKVGDLFGLIKKEHIFPVDMNLVAYPNERSLILRDMKSSSEQDTISTQMVNVGTSSILASVREYVPGDKLSRVDWKQTAKQNKIMTKEFEHEIGKHTLLVLDRTTFEGINRLAFEGAIEVTLALIGVLEKQTEELEFLSIGEEIASFRLHEPNSRNRIRRHLAKVQLEKGELFTSLLDKEFKKRSNRFILVLITTQINELLFQVIKTEKQRSKEILIFFVRAKKGITQKERLRIDQLQLTGVTVHLLTENELIKDPLEVSIL